MTLKIPSVWNFFRSFADMFGNRLRSSFSSAFCRQRREDPLLLSRNAIPRTLFGCWQLIDSRLENAALLVEAGPRRPHGSTEDQPLTIEGR